MLNGVMSGDWELYMQARGNAVIDYILMNEFIYDKVKLFKVDDRVDSDHMTVLETMEEERKGTKEYGAEEEKINEEKIGEANSG